MVPSSAANCEIDSYANKTEFLLKKGVTHINSLNPDITITKKLIKSENRDDNDNQ